MTTKLICLAGEFKGTDELQKYCDGQYVALRSAIEKIKALQDEVTNLQQMLVATTPLIQDDRVSKIIVSPEAALIDAQISIIQNSSMHRPMSLEEVKILDLLIKNKNLLSGDATTINIDKKEKAKSYSNAQLIDVAKREK